jgi:4-hydroxybenzoate polyprenyltransferase
MARSMHSHPAASDTPATVSARLGRRSVLTSLFISLRPHQWTKNLLVFAGLLFGLKLLDPVAIARSVIAFAVFCALAGVVYLINDIVDRETDKQHPTKSLRPIAAGDLAVSHAAMAAAIILTGALGVAFSLGRWFGIVATSYVALQSLYSFSLKHIVIVDALALSAGFVLRAVAGTVVLDVAISHWLLVCTILLALFMALAKRRHEIVLLADGATSHRPILAEYSAYLLDQMIGVVTASTLIAYIFYTISPETEEKFGTTWLGLTIPFPIYGIFRYLYLVHRREGGGNPSDMLLNDRPLLACVVLWAIAVALIVYHPFRP